LGIFFLFLTNFLDTLTPLILKRAIDQVSAGAEKQAILYTGLMFFLLMVALAGFRYLWRYFFGTYHTLAAEDLRCRVFKHLLHMSPQFFQKKGSGELISTMTNDIQAFRMGIGNAVLVLVDGTLLMAMILPIMIYYNWEWTWKTLLFVPILPLLIAYLMKMIFETFLVEQTRLAALSDFIQETLNGIRTIKSFAKEDIRKTQFDRLNASYEQACHRTAFYDSLFGPVMELAVGLGSAILIFVAIDDLLLGTATLGTFIAFQRYIAKMIWPITAMGFGLSNYRKGMASFQRIRELLETLPEVPDQGTQVLKEVQKYEIQNLNFSFGEQEVLKNVSFHFTKGQRVGIMGPIGSGKSVLAQVLVRLFETPKGSLLINGVPIQDFSLESLRNKIFLNPQEPTIFSMSIADNLKLAKSNATEEELWQVLARLKLDDEVKGFPAGLGTQIGEKGVNLSGGQRQRLAMARALLADPDVLILDDCLSAVDLATEQSMLESLRDFKKTIVIISHRPQVLESCDQIVLMENGQITRSGKAHEVPIGGQL
jgi:ATP-binding cassette subfamily B protein